MFVHNTKKGLPYHLHLLHFSPWNPFLKFLEIPEVNKNCPLNSGINRRPSYHRTLKIEHIIEHLKFPAKLTRVQSSDDDSACVQSFSDLKIQQVIQNVTHLKLQ